MKINIPEIVGKGYGKFWDSKKRYRVLKGGKGSKKSTTTALNIIYRMMKYPGANTLVVRQVMDTHRTSTYAQLKWAIHQLAADQYWKCTTAPIEMVYIPTGQKILFRGFDDVYKLASTVVEKGYLCWVWIEEAFELSDKDYFDKLDLSVPRGTVPNGLFKQTTITFNPWSDTHWLKAKFFDKPKDNVDTFSTNYLCNEFLDKTDLELFEDMKLHNPRKYEVAGLGNWGIADGLIYEQWRVETFDKNRIGIHEIDGKEINDSWKYKYVFGLDYGYTNDPSAFIAYAANPIDRKIYIFDEFYEKGLLNRDIAKRIIKMGYSKEHIRADSAEPKSNADLRYQWGIRRLEGAVKGKDSIKNGISSLQEYEIIVHPSCKNTISELSSYVWKVSKDGSGKNEPVDSNNHLMDAMRYAFLDVKNFKPITDEQRSLKEKAKFKSRILNPNDFKGGWG